MALWEYVWLDQHWWKVSLNLDIATERLKTEFINNNGQVNVTEVLHGKYGVILCNVFFFWFQTLVCSLIKDYLSIVFFVLSSLFSEIDAIDLIIQNLLCLSSILSSIMYYIGAHTSVNIWVFLLCLQANIINITILKVFCDI